ncbi:MAG: hypothetical protein MJ240_03740 [Kiritimatiellae bacterium]|nr:hypothetical protein [Kiritimatiellia bacterium]
MKNDKIFGAALMAVLAAGAAFGYDWPAAGGTATLTEADCDANGEVVVTDADYAAANALAGIQVGAGVKLVFDTAQAPTVALSGTGGTFVKRGDAEWSITTAQPNFRGDWVLEGGVTIVEASAAKTAFGIESGSYALYVRSGASFTATAAAASAGWRLSSRKLHLAGTGYQNRGAYYSLGNTSDTFAWTDFILDDDATIRLDNGYLFARGTTYDFNGHALTLLGSKNLYFMSGKCQNGRFVVGDGTDRPQLCERGTFAMTDAGFETVLNHGSTLCLYNEPAAYPGKLTVNGTATLLHSHQTASDICVEDETTVCLAGPVHLAQPGSVLTCKFSDQSSFVCDPYWMMITGYVYGPGGLTVAATGSRLKTVVLSCPTNAFTGPVNVTAGELRLPAHGAVPDYEKVTVSGGAVVTAVLPAEGEAWTEEQIGDLTKMSLDAMSLSVVDRSASGLDGSLVYAAADLEAASAADKPATLRVGVRPADSVISVTGNFTKAFQPVAWGGNTVAVAGAVPQLSAMKVSSDTATFTGTLAVTNAGTMTFEYPYYVGTQGGARDLLLAHTAVTMEGLRQNFSRDDKRDDYCPDYTNNAVIVGSYDSSSKGVAHPGRLTIGEDCTLTARCMCAWGQGAAARQTQGAVIQTGGETCFLGSGSDSLAAIWGYYAPCAVTLADGTMTWRGYHQFGIGGENLGYSTFLQTGGEFRSLGMTTTGECFVDVGRSGAVRADWLQTGGTSHFYGNILLARSGGSRASITVTGSNTLFIADKGVAWGYDKGANPILSIRDGAVFRGYLTASRFKSSYHAKNDWWAVFSCYVDGGWITSTSSPLAYMGDMGNPLSESSYGPTRIVAAGAGLGIDTLAGNTSAGNPIHSASGNGVAGIEGGWQRLETELVARPFVEILGDGTNATAFALMDGGAITNILVTNPGEDYTVATAKVMTAMSAGGTPAFSYFPCALAPNVPGGLNKRGTGSLKLVATNDYVGMTRVLEGKLYLGDANLISSESALSVEGGTFDFGGYTNKFHAVGGPAGMITGCAASVLEVETLLPGTTTDLVFNGISLRVTGEFALSGADLLAGKGPAYATAVTFDEGAGIRLTDTEGLDPKKRGGYAILSATGGLTGAKVLNADELPPAWSLVTYDNKLRIAHLAGLSISFR